MRLGCVWDVFGIISGCLWDDFGMIWGLIWDYVGMFFNLDGCVFSTFSHGNK